MIEGIEGNTDADERKNKITTWREQMFQAGG